MAPSAQGVFVGLVTPDSPAEATGIQAGDVIFELDGRPVSDAQEILSQIASVGSSGSLRLGVHRGAHVRLFRVEPVPKPAALPSDEVSAQTVVTLQPSAKLEQGRRGD